MASAEVNNPTQTPPVFWSHLGNWIRLIPRSAVLSMIGPSMLLLVGYFGWRFYGAKNYDAAYYGLRQENLVLTPQPQWLKESVVEQLFQKSGLENLSFLDRQTSVVLARTLEQHPAVREIHRVQPVSGGQIYVSVEYRTPIAMVRCEIGDETGGTHDRFVPIDKDGVLLPESNFSSTDVVNYIWICVDGLKFDPDWKHGSRLTDPRILDAARLCAVLQSFREQVKAEKVFVDKAPSDKVQTVGKSRWWLEIQTADPGPTVIWGEAPEMSKTDGVAIDNSTRAKVSRLLDAASDRTQWSKELIDLTKQRP